MEQQALAAGYRKYPQVSAGLTYYGQLEQRDSIGASAAEWDPGQRLLYSIGASYALFHWGAVTAAAEIGKISGAIAENNYGEAYRLLVLQVRSDYLNLIIGKASLRAAEFGLQMQKDALALVKEQADAGEVSSSAYSSAQFAFDEAQLGFERTQLAFDATVERFRRLIGSETFEAAAIPDEFPVVSQSTPEQIAPLRDAFLADEGWKEQTLYENQESAIEQQRLQERIWRVNQRPTLNLTTGLSQDELSREVDITERSSISYLYIGASINWNIFDGFYTRRQLLSTRTTLLQLQQTLEQYGEDLKQASLNAFKEVELSGRSLYFAQYRYESAQGNVSYYRENFDLGLASELDVKNAEASELGARPTIYSARAAYLNAIASFLSSVNADPIVASGMNRTDGS
jgi:outer membrane protein TolC